MMSFLCFTVQLHKDHAALWEHIDRKILPKEYGGEMPMSEMIELFKQEISDRSPRVIALDRMQLDLDVMKKSASTNAKKVSNDILGMSGNIQTLDLTMGKGSPKPDQLSQKDFQSLYTANKYVCTLDPAVLAVAKKELREDEKTRDQALEQMRQWIRKTAFIKDCRLDANFLLRFLRNKKFSVPMAQETLLKYIAMRQQHTTWFQYSGVNDSAVMDFINRGIILVLPKRDQEGRRVILTSAGSIDPQLHTVESLIKAIMVVFEFLLEDEVNQIRGFSHLMDQSGVTASHLVLWNPSELSRLIGACEKSVPMRHKRVDVVSLPSWVNYILDFAKSLMSEKLRSRIWLHEDRAALLKKVDGKILPKEYGGEVPLSEMISLFKQEIVPCLPRIIALNKLQLDLEMMKSSSSANANKGCNDASTDLLVHRQLIQFAYV
ncbi:unnamed protein product [Allacma fusca]|uniref:CRAL-TRIO domain-containing protein n=1 Tax=Allacma fusca TaxID=39272 RepID=A0A8J2L1B8_9HEXA|nr:unnamed protein product [Allacma fusca]